MKSLNPASIPAPLGSYSHAMLLDPGRQMLFLSGQVAMDRDGNVPQTIEEQSQMIWQNIFAILKEADMTVENIVKLLTFITNDALVVPHAKVRAGFMAGHKPASTLVVVPRLIDCRLLVEVDCIAAS